MVNRMRERQIQTESAGENLELRLDKLLSDETAPAALRTYARASLDVGAEVAYHVHTGECECYYILSGNGEYDDNGEKVLVTAGDVTFTANGQGHGMKNIGTDTLEFMALIIRDEK